MRAVKETFLASITFERSLLSVCTDVRSKVIALNVALLAIWTFVRSNIGMHLQMEVKARSKSETTCTDMALKVLLARMNTSM